MSIDFKHLFIAGLLLSSTGCMDPCGNHILNDMLSPDNSNRAIVFERDCGAATDFSTQVSILSANERLPREAGNVFIADSDHAAITTMEVRVRWNSRERIVISLSSSCTGLQEGNFSEGGINFL